MPCVELADIALPLPCRSRLWWALSLLPRTRALCQIRQRWNPCLVRRCGCLWRGAPPTTRRTWSGRRGYPTGARAAGHTMQARCACWLHSGAISHMLLPHRFLTSRPAARLRRCRLHYWRYKHLGQEYLIWGLTAGILIVVAERAFGCKAAFDVSPPGARPYTDLFFDGTQLRYRSTALEPGSAAAAAATAGERLLAQPLGASLARRASLDQQQAQQRLSAGVAGTAAYHTTRASQAGPASGAADVQERGHWVENNGDSDQG
jgi:hypothetical protein